jgi:hypothetical protein
MPDIGHAREGAMDDDEGDMGNNEGNKNTDTAKELILCSERRK